MREGLATEQTRDGVTRYGCERCVIEFGDEAGWEAAVFDHYQAMVVALASKLHAGTRRADLGDSVGGSTFVFDLWRGRPMQAEVLGYLRSVREHGIALRKALELHNARSPMPRGAAALRVPACVGQGVTESEGDEDAQTLE